MPPRISINGPFSESCRWKRTTICPPLTGSNGSPDHSPITSANFSDMAPIRGNADGSERGDSGVQSDRKVRRVAT